MSADRDRGVLHQRADLLRRVRRRRANGLLGEDRNARQHDESDDDRRSHDWFRHEEAKQGRAEGSANCHTRIVNTMVSSSAMKI
jgi:hypothetical protein